MGETAVDITGLIKRFPGGIALDDVGLTLKSGEIHALMGENGAGKSTLIKCLAGVHRPDGGRIALFGREYSPESPAAAERAGISTVFQEVDLCARLTVAENVTIGREDVRFGLIRPRAARDRARRALARLGLAIDVDRPVGRYPVAIRQLTAIARALDVDAKVLVLDEPTASLDEKETAALFDVMRRLADGGMAILFVTHFLDQVFRISDRVSVLRNGRNVAAYPTNGLVRARLVADMLGRESAPHAGEAARKGIAENAAPLVIAEGLVRRGAVDRFDGAFFAGKITALLGLLGSGRSETARLLFGVDPAEAGVIRVNGETVVIGSPRRAAALGFAFSPESRKEDGVFPNLSVRENILVALQARRGAFARIADREAKEIVERLAAALSIKAPSLDAPMRALSGGNQQKVILARWIATAPAFFILDEPTRGIDVGAKAEVAALIRDLADRGAAVLFISSELEETALVADRAILMRDRRSRDTVEGPGIDVRTLVRMIAEGGHE